MHCTRKNFSHRDLPDPGQRACRPSRGNDPLDLFLRGLEQQLQGIAKEEREKEKNVMMQKTEAGSWNYDS